MNTPFFYGKSVFSKSRANILKMIFRFAILRSKKLFSLTGLAFSGKMKYIMTYRKQ
jgi:hypothetical protein